MRIQNLAAVIAAIALALLFGAIASTGSIMLIGAILGLSTAVFLLFSPKFLLLATLLCSLVISGVAEFYFGIGQANWIPSLLGLSLFVAAFLAHKEINTTYRRIKIPSVIPTVVLFTLALFIASAINLITPIQLITGVRNYLPFIGVFVALLAMRVLENDLQKWIKALLCIGLLQLPFCLHQALVVAPRRERSFAAVGGGAEAIVGSFGGNPLGGGYTGEMAVFVLIMSLFSLALASNLKRGKILAFLMCSSAIGCVAMAETKIVFVLAPITVLILFYEDIRHSPKRMLGVLLAISTVLGGLAAVYAWRFWSKGPDEFWHAFTYSFDPNFMVDRLHRGRIAALFHWWGINIENFDFLHATFGYGMASTLEASRVLGEGNAVKMFGLGLDAHAANKLLWDGGLLSFGVFSFLIVRSGLNAHRLVNRGNIPIFHVNALKAIRAAMFCFAAMLPYQVSVVGGAPMQFLFWFFVGYIEYWRRFVSKTEQ